ncbi:MAG TPA: hypothetical protein VD763_03915 [Candidatus Saccharimonadales bacterium]|nr:hypothetical protein [Candidatus Saccharimonadales bacterium]
MTRPVDHPAAKPFRISRAVVAAHREHAPVPFMGCPVCIRRGVVGAVKVRWTSPRQA